MSATETRIDAMAAWVRLYLYGDGNQGEIPLLRREPRRYTATTETLMHFHQHLDCQAGPGYWTIGDGDPTRAYFCPYCGTRLEAAA